MIGFPGGGIRRMIESGGRIEPTTEVSTLNAAYRRKVVEAVGGFDERLKWGGEDDFFAKKACKHGSCLFVPAAVVTHKPRGSLPAYGSGLSEGAESTSSLPEYTTTKRRRGTLFLLCCDPH